MSRVSANGIELAYEQFGRDEDPAVILIMGFNMALTAWPEGFCRRLVEGGYRVIRFDNRDVGQSSRLTQLGEPAFATSIRRRVLGLRVAPPYTLDDMAADTIGLMDALDIQQAHLVGISMGGMIAQIMALEHADRVASMALLMTHSGSMKYLFPTPELARVMLHQPGPDLESQIAYGLRFWAVLAGPDYPPDPAQLTQAITEAFHRAGAPHGRKRQFAAIMAARDRRHRLAGLDLPVSVIHGSRDPMIRPQAGERLAAAIPGASFHLVQGLGHDLPPALWSTLCGHVLGNLQR
ncbi:MAG: alpha/beta hydrolase [Xanthomonadales bacterium]|nr:alpha/beta hydrolase [Xanthomonadales bacterium]